MLTNQTAAPRICEAMVMSDACSLTGSGIQIEKLSENQRLKEGQINGSFSPAQIYSSLRLR